MHLPQLTLVHDRFKFGTFTVKHERLTLEFFSNKKQNIWDLALIVLRKEILQTPNLKFSIAWIESQVA